MDRTLNLSVFFILLTVFTLSIITESKQLDDYILHYEELNYNTDHLHERHMRHKRSLDSAVHFDLHAFKKKISLRLKNDQSVFAPNFVLHFNGTITKPDLSFIYSGEVVDKPGSKVVGGILNGVFTGSISIPTDQETYHVENSHRFFKDNKPVFHSVIYKESDMNLDPFRERRTRERREAEKTGTCGYANAKDFMREVVQSEVKPANRAKRHENVWQEVNNGDNFNKYTERANSKPEKIVSRKKRASLSSVNNKKNSCFMSLMSDKFLYDHFLENSNNNAELARDAILLFFATHINAIKSIYMDTVFKTYDGSLSYTGVTFAVQKTKILTGADCTGEYASFCQPNIDVSNFLNLNSLFNHNEFCLAYVFTYRDFSAGTLGLAWVGAANSASGGVCEKNKEFTEKNTRVKKSLNTGICTIINYGKTVPSKVSQLTFAHEVGHNFGSPHDSGTECAPYGTTASDANQGNYIMYASATMGDKPHNSEFSRCSKDNITRVIHAVLTSPSKSNCFEESGPFCGNGIVEGDEECDCGFAEDCEDQCCIARKAQGTVLAQQCKLAAGADCSPTQGPCCETSCVFTKDLNKVCRYSDECYGEAKCNGNSAICPNSDIAENGKYCNSYGFTCKNGECAGSLCERFNWTECFITGQTSTKEEQEQLCKLGCTNGTGGECILSSESDKLTTEYQKMVDEVFNGRKSLKKGGTDSVEDGIQLAPGSPCNNFQGYCDVFYRCRGVDAEGPLSRLKNLIFDPETLQDISDWIVEHWWAVLLMGVGLVIAMGLFIKFCAVHTPSSNPKAKPARKLSETMTLRRRRNQNRQAAPNPQPVRYPQNPQGPPPPYPGSSSGGMSSNLGPPHGHGKKGKNKKGQNMEMGRI